MAEDVNIVDPDMGSGYNYDSLFDWEAGEQADIDTPGTIAVAKCRCTGGTADTTGVTIDGWTTSAADYIKIWTDPAESYRHTGKWTTGNKYRLEPTGAQLLINEDYVRIYGLQIKTSLGSANGVVRVIASYYDSSNIIIGYCYIHNTGQGACIYGYYTTIDVYNTVAYVATNREDRADNSVVFGSTNCYINLKNCTLIGNSVENGVNSSAVSCIIDCQNVIINGAENCMVGGARITGNYNLTSDATAVGANSVINTTLTFVDAANQDYHLSATDSAAIGAGTNLYAGGWQDDIDGDDRGGAAAAWDIGADEYVAVGGASIVPILLHQYRARRQ